MTLKQSIRRVAKQGNLVPAVVRAVRNNRVTVQLSGNGAIMRMLHITGGPVIIGQSVHVDFTTNPPIVVAPTPSGVTIIDGGARKLAKEKQLSQQASARPESNMIEVYDGPPPTSGKPDTYPKGMYSPDSSGLISALELCQDGDVVYIPACSISGNISIPTLYNDGNPSAQNIFIIGKTQADTILTGGIIASNGVTFKDISFERTANLSSSVYNIYAVGNCSFYNCYFETANTGTGDTINVYVEFSSEVRFYNCGFSAEDRCLALGPIEGPYYALDYNALAQAAQCVGSYGLPDDIYGTLNKRGITWQADSFFDLDDWAYTALVYALSYSPGKNRGTGYKIRLVLSLANDSSEITANPLHKIEDQTTWLLRGGSWEYTNEMMNSADNSFPEYINGVWDADHKPYGPGDTIMYEWTNTTSGSSNSWTFFISRDSIYTEQGLYVKLWFEEIYILYPDGSREYLYPCKPHAYLEDCALYGGLYDLCAHGASLIEVNRCSYDKTKTLGNILVWVDGHPGILTSGSAPITTYPGMMWLEP